MYVQVSELPDTLRTALKACGYHRKDINVEAREKYCPMQPGGDGYRAFCCVVDLATGRYETHMGSWGGANMFNPQNAIDLDRAEYPIPDGVAVIEGHQGGGRPVYASLCLSPTNVAKMLPPPAELSDRERSILRCASYKSGYRKAEYARMQVTDAELAALVAAGYLEKRGNGLSITTKGRNARGS